MNMLTMRWTITLITAVTMAVINFFTIWIISFAVEWKFNTLQARGIENLQGDGGIRPPVGAITLKAKKVTLECEGSESWMRVGFSQPQSHGS